MKVPLSISAILMVIFLSGCASYSENDDKSVTTYGFLRTLTVQKKYNDAGLLIEKTISTQSNSADVLLSAKEIIDTTVDTASKLKP
jgi:hypothetical protein